MVMTRSGKRFLPATRLSHEFGLEALARPGAPPGAGGDIGDGDDVGALDLLPVPVPKRRHSIKRLKMPIHPQGPNRPLSTTQLQIP